MNLKDMKELYSYGVKLYLVGILAILTQIIVNFTFLLMHSKYDVIPSDIILNLEEQIILGVIVGIGLISTFGIFIGKKWFNQTNSPHGRRLIYWMALFSTLAINASLMQGGGWFAGVIFANIGICMILYTILGDYKQQLSKIGRSSKDMDAKSDLDNNIEIQNDGKSGTNQDITQKNKKKSLTSSKKKSIILVSCLIGLVAISALIPYGVNLSRIPAPLMPSVSSPPTNIQPNHENTFYIMPIWEGMANGESELAYMKSILGGDAYTGKGFIKIGRSVSCWYTNSIYNNGSFNPSNLIAKLTLANTTNTPILFHMNGGNWGQGGSKNPVIQSMRENVSNCQWDQNNVCHPIKYNPGPNDRFWCFAPVSDWEIFRERNIKQALDIIFNWWQNNPDLLVGFSTDSEIHLNYHKFTEVNEGNYTSYFDYNPSTIAQYRDWAKANWTLAEYNSKCKTNYASWEEVDAPRNKDVVGKIGNIWWETWTDFRIWHVKEAGLRQCRWIHEMGFPRELIWHHQILSEPGDKESRYVRCDPIETAINPYCNVGITRYGWIEPEIWHSLGALSLEKTDNKLPSFGIFEWNLWHQHEYWAYREMLNNIYQYGGHVICPNEWVNASRNEGLWIPGEECVKAEPYEENGVTYGSDECGCGGNNNSSESACIDTFENGTCKHWVYRHGNPQFIQALQDFIAIGQDYERGSCLELRMNKPDVIFFDQFDNTFDLFNSEGLYLMGGVFFLCIVYILTISRKSSKIRKKMKRI
jgi:hypothetical protein